MQRSTTYSILYSFFLFAITFNYAQDQKVIHKDSLKVDVISSVNSTNAEQGDVDFTDGTNSLIRITDEGSFGAIEIKSGVPSSSDDKLYNDSGTLKFNGTTIGSASNINNLDDLSDAKNDGSSLFLGDGAGEVDDSGLSDGQKNENTSIGTESLNRNVSGESNTATGYFSSQLNTTGQYNSSFGARALRSNTTGDLNTAIGYEALKSNVSGNDNVAIGASVLSGNTSGYQNFAGGRSSLSWNSTGYGNVAVGFLAQHRNTTGMNNVGLGNFTNQRNSEGSNNTLIGHGAGGGGTSIHSKSGNVFLGYLAGFNEFGDDKLYIENSLSSTPLIWGDFATDIVKINGDLIVTGSISSNGFANGLISINDLSDAIHDSQSIFLGLGSGINDNGNSDGIDNYNIGIGVDVLQQNSAGYFNTGIGFESLSINEGIENISLGHQSSKSSTSANYNTVIGVRANYFNEKGSRNTILGLRSGYGLVGKSYYGAVYIGHEAGYFETADNKLYIENSNSTTPLIWGDFSTDSLIINGGLQVTSKTKTPLIQITDGAINGHVLTSDESGNASWQQLPASNNVDELKDLSDARYDGSSLFLGTGAGIIDNGSNENVAIGKDALIANTSGNRNTATGYNTLTNNITGQSNTATGYMALSSNIDANGNTAIGNEALKNNTTGPGNTATGDRSLESNTTGLDNTANGLLALNSNTEGWVNSAFGTASLSLNTTGSRNSAFGYHALAGNTVGDSNTAVGAHALFRNNNGEGNVGVGFGANYNNLNGSNNTIIGHMAGGGPGTSGHDKSGNVFLGNRAGFSETGSDKLYIENSSSSSPLIWGDFSNDIVAINGDFGVNTLYPTARVDIKADNSGEVPFRVAIEGATKLKVHPNGGTSIGSNASATPVNGLYVNGPILNPSGTLHPSDIRFKSNIKTIDNVLPNIEKLNGVYYDWKVRDFPNRGFSDKKQIGVIAQEIEAIYPELVATLEDGFKTVDYSKLTPILLEAIKELNNKVNNLENEKQQLKSVIAENHNLSNELERLKATVNKIIDNQQTIKFSSK